MGEVKGFIEFGDYVRGFEYKDGSDKSTEVCGWVKKVRLSDEVGNQVRLVIKVDTGVEEVRETEISPCLGPIENLKVKQ